MWPRRDEGDQERMSCRGRRARGVQRSGQQHPTLQTGQAGSTEKGLLAPRIRRLGQPQGGSGSSQEMGDYFGAGAAVKRKRWAVIESEVDEYVCNFFVGSLSINFTSPEVCWLKCNGQNINTLLRKRRRRHKFKALQLLYFGKILWVRITRFVDTNPHTILKTFLCFSRPQPIRGVCVCVCVSVWVGGVRGEAGTLTLARNNGAQPFYERRRDQSRHTSLRNMRVHLALYFAPIHC